MAKISLVEMQERLDSKFPNKFSILQFDGVKNKDCYVKCILGNHVFTDIRLQDLEKHGMCPICNKSHLKKKKDLSLIKLEIESLLDNKYEYIEGYSNNQSKLKLLHLNCGAEITNLTFNRISQGKVFCPVCESERKLSITRVKKELESIDSNYEVVDTKYEGTHAPLEVRHIQCNHTYKVSRTNFKNGRRCPFCTRTGKISKGHLLVRDILVKNKLIFTENVKMKEWVSTNNGSLELDFLIADLKIIIEYDGEQHFKPKFGEANLIVQKNNDILKDEYAKNNGYHMLRINYTEKDFSCIEFKIKKFIEEVQRLSKV